ncbi:borealin-2-like isoform X2 [Pithys albifrons albifrons]|uniref:borealin-2-like isoform X2 n=1 Tax=Pithys albifrons albifrons TaxID=3385563 RepID=UPI003A5CC060
MVAMPLRKPSGKLRSSDSGVEPDRGALPLHTDQRLGPAQEKKDQRISLFLSDFDQQAKEHIQEMKKELDSLLQTAEKAFAVELLTVPAAIRKMKRKDLLNFQGGEEMALAAAMTACSLEDIPNPKLMRTNSKKVKVTTIVEYEDAKHISAKKVTKKMSKTKSLVSLASGFNGKLNPLSSATNLKASPKASQSAGLQQTGSRTLPTRGRVQGMLKRSKSVPQNKPVPFVNIPLADGQTFCTAGGDLQNIDVQLLNQDTVQHIHNLVNELTLLCGKATAEPS